jgi:hypothetical protein
MTHQNDIEAISNGYFRGKHAIVGGGGATPVTDQTLMVQPLFAKHCLPSIVCQALRRSVAWPLRFLHCSECK